MTLLNLAISLFSFFITANLVVHLMRPLISSNMSLFRGVNRKSKPTITHEILFHKHWEEYDKRMRLENN
jgi:hypothetical protein